MTIFLKNNNIKSRNEEPSDCEVGVGVGGWLLIQRAVIPFTLIAAPPINLFSFSQSQPTSLTLIGCTSSSILIFGNLARETIPHIIKLNRRSPVRQLSSAPQQERSAEDHRVKLSPCALQCFLRCFGDFESQNMSKRLVEKVATILITAKSLMAIHLGSKIFWW